MRFHASTRFLILATLGLQVMFILAFALFGTQGVHTISREEDFEFYESISRIKAANKLEAAAQQEVIQLRGSALSGKPDPALALAISPYLYHLADLKHHVLEPPNQARIARVEAAGRAFHDCAGRVQALLAAHQLEAARALCNGEGARLTTTWQGAIADTVDANQAATEHIHTQVDETEDSFKLRFLLASLAELPIGLVMAVLLTRRVVEPLRELEHASRLLAEGQLAIRAPVARPDEFGHVTQAFNAMAEKVEGSVNALNEANQALRQLDQTKDEFLSIASHELKTPLNAIKGFAGLLGNQYAEGMNKLQLQYVDNIAQSTDRLIRLVGELLDVATIRLGKFSLTRQPHNLALLVEDVLETMQPIAQERGVDLVANVHARPVVPLDYDRITQVLTNLIGNAIKFTSPGGCIQVVVEARGHELVTEVRDSGIGIAPGDVSKLFQPFTQVDMSSARKAGGTGLGLAISKALIEAHGGHIGLTSRPGSGSVFWFALPLASNMVSA